VSFDVFVQRFENGDSVPLDHAAVRNALAEASSAPLPVPDGGHLRLKTDDGGADLYGLRPGTMAFMLNRINGLSAWNVIWNIAHTTSAVLLAVGAPAIATTAETLDQLPTELKQAAIVGTDPASLLQVLKAS